jgi:acetyl esterase/lipase
MSSANARWSGSLRYGALVHALWSLRGGTFFEPAQPIERAVPYRVRPVRGIAPVGDVYVPPRPTGTSVVMVHGGGFVIGSRDMLPMRHLAARLGAAGIAAFAIDYRMIFRGGRFDEALDDVTAAVEHWHDRAPRYGLDPSRVALLGLSAGGTLAMLAAARIEDRVHRLVCGFGLYELDHLEGPLASAMPRLLFRSADRDLWHARSPRGQRQPRVPTLLLHGTDDGLVPVEQARRLAAHRESLGLPTTLAIYEGAPHGFFNFACDAGEQAIAEIVRHVDEAP